MQTFIEQFIKIVPGNNSVNNMGTMTKSKENGDCFNSSSMKTITESRESLDYNSFLLGTMTRTKEQQDNL